MGLIHDTKDDRNIEIDKVGVTKYKLPIIFNSGDKYSSVANIESFISLDPTVKGAHLSRIVEVLDEKVANNEITLENFKNILFELRDRLENNNASLKMNFDIVTPSITPITNRITYLNSNIELNGKIVRDKLSQSISLTSNGAMLCPNSKNISDYGAHSQKCNLKATLFDNIDDLKVKDILSIIFSQFSAEVYGIIKSADEKYLTEKAYNNPKFSEDLVRDTLIKLREYFKEGRIEVEIENLESIHQHNVYSKGILR